MLPVDTDWDLGVRDSTAIWFTQSLRSGEVRVIDYYENSGEGIPHYVRVLAEKSAVAIAGATRPAGLEPATLGLERRCRGLPRRTQVGCQCS